MQKPTPCIKAHVRTINGTHGRNNIHPWASTIALFSKYMVVEVSQVSDDQKQALVNAINYVRNPTPQAEKALGAGLRVQRYNKFGIYAKKNVLTGVFLQL